MDYYADKKLPDGGKWWISFTRFKGELYLLPTVRFGWGPCLESTKYHATSAGIYWLQWAVYGGLTKAR